METFQAMSESEFEVMEVIWSYAAPITSAEVIDALNKTQTWKPSTVWTFLGRLSDKGFVHTEKKGKRSFYTPALTKEMYLQLQTDDFIKTVHGGSVKSLVSALSTDSNLSKSDLLELQQWLAEQSGE